MATPDTPFARAVWSWTGGLSPAESLATEILATYARRNAHFANLLELSKGVCGIMIESHPVPGTLCCITNAPSELCRTLVISRAQRVKITLERSLALCLWGLVVFENRTRGAAEAGWLGPDPAEVPNTKRHLFAAFTMIDRVGLGQTHFKSPHPDPRTTPFECPPQTPP